ncbi:PHB depolymerase family esterase [Kutzneria sp. NPDC051319]|uniref:extracellular catalytic domain type 1 short-chain-length polyhydroxyalkanoate depolymerase n=1 Tax=Kutzneria sp. NPDC051319 TaxID=3155047 RepID=UPI00342C89B2
MRLKSLLTAATAMAVCVAMTVIAPQASAATLTQVTNFGNNPSNLQMYEYVPNNVQAHPAILLALHGCQGSGPYLYSSTQFASLADQYGFIVIYPSVTRSYDCWDVSSPSSLTHNGNNDPAGLVSMIQYVEQHNGADAGRVYVTGESSGAMMTDVMLGDYPNVFKAGAAFMGVPFGCFATTDGSQWNSQCAQGQLTKTPQQWGDLVRGAYPGYSGPRPRMQLWHGTADTTLNYHNFGEEIKQWTNVFGLSQTPTATDTPQSGWTRTRYADGSGTVDVEAYSIAGVGHALPQNGMAAYAIHFLGLDSGGGGGQTAGQLRAVGASKCLDGSTSAGTQVQIQDCSGAASQSWTRNGLAIQSGGSTCLDAYGNGTATGTKVVLWSCNGQANQQWQVNANGTITGVQSGLCLDVSGRSTASGALVQLWTCNGGSNQQWTLSS